MKHIFASAIWRAVSHTLSALSVLRSKASRLSGKKKCSLPKFSRSFRQISLAKAFRAPGYSTGSRRLTWKFRQPVMQEIRTKSNLSVRNWHMGCRGTLALAFRLCRENRLGLRAAPASRWTWAVFGSYRRQQLVASLSRHVGDFEQYAGHS